MKVTPAEFFGRHHLSGRGFHQRLAAEEGWQDPVSRKALQFIERRQRNRAAIAKSPYGGLEEAVAAAEQMGMSREIATEIAYLSGIKPITGAKILGDPSGEPLAILCKATGLGRNELQALWRIARAPALVRGEECCGDQPSNHHLSIIVAAARKL